MSSTIAIAFGSRVPRSAWALLFAQSLSLFGSSLARFAVGVWVYQTTGSVGSFSTIAILSMLPGLLVSPWAGALVDRLPKRRVIILSDVLAAVGMVAIFVAVKFDAPVLPVIYTATAMASISDAFQWPALGSFVSQIVPPAALSRFNGLLETSRSLSTVGAPALAGLLLSLVGLDMVVAMEVITCALSTVVLIVARFPAETVAPSTTLDGQASSLRADIAEGFFFIRNHFGLKYLLALFVALNFFSSIAHVLFQPFALSFLSATETGFVAGATGAGMVVGGLILGLWGGPKNKASGVAWLGVIEGFACLAYGAQNTFVGLVVFSFAQGFVLPFLNGCSQTVWQLNTPLSVQGRVFSVRRMFAWITNPLAFAIAAPLSVAAGGIGNTIAYAGIGITVSSCVFLLAGVLRPLDRSVVEKLKAA